MNASITTTTTRPRRSRWAVALFAGVAGFLGVTSVAWACTQIMGQIKICSVSTGTCTDTATGSKGSGAPGSTIKVRAKGLRVKPATYALYFADAASLHDCHSSLTILKSPAGDTLNNMTTNKYGELDRNLSMSGIQPYKAVIPANALSGDAIICGREVTPEKEDSATAHASFTIVSGS
ncbi:MAG: hypothetical protein M3P85_07580 [Actinomycetota bacterium]|nr:hypothetical protein [Actinomycetota bacterium]